MVAVVIAIARNMISKETIDEAFNTEDKMDIPLAPSLGLCLCHVRNDSVYFVDIVRLILNFLKMSYSRKCIDRCITIIIVKDMAQMVSMKR